MEGPRCWSNPATLPNKKGLARPLKPPKVAGVFLGSTPTLERSDGRREHTLTTLKTKKALQ